VRRIRDLPCGDARISLEVEVRRVRCKRCGTVKREKLPWLANNPFYTKRFSFYVGRKAAMNQGRGKRAKLDWHAVKALEKEYMEEQLRRNPVAAPRAIGIDELSLRKGHTYRIVVSDLERGRPIWYGGKDRSEASMDIFYEWLGAKKAKKIQIAVMDMWKAFEKLGRMSRAMIPDKPR
jgi:transposase